MRLRRARAEDALQIADLHARNWRRMMVGIAQPEYLSNTVSDERLTYWTHELQRLGDPTFDMRLAMDGVGLAGFVCTDASIEIEWGVYLHNLHVREDAAGHGLGHQLFRAAKRFAAKVRPGAALHLLVYEENAAARLAYEAWGGRVVERLIDPVPGGGEAWCLRYLWEDRQTA
jgi:ribosomal protein S18 acetylase RimI-like enzyme